MKDDEKKPNSLWLNREAVEAIRNKTIREEIRKASGVYCKTEKTHMTHKPEQWRGCDRAINNAKRTFEQKLPSEVKTVPLASAFGNKCTARSSSGRGHLS